MTTARWVDLVAHADVILAGLVLIAWGVGMVGFVALLVRVRRHDRQRNETVHPPVRGGHVRVLPTPYDQDKETADGR